MRSLWMDPAAGCHAPLAGDIKVDVAIVGGGLSGVGAAFGLMHTDQSVALLEERTIASGASGRNAGFVLAGPAGFREAIDAVGPEAINAIWQLTVENNKLIASLVDEYELACEYLRRGSMSLAASHEEWAELQLLHSELVAMDISACLISPEDLPRPFDSLYHGGIYYAGNAEINPAHFVRGIAATLAHTVSIHEGTRVEQIGHRDGWQLVTAGGTVTAASVVLTTNAYTPALLEGAPIRAIRGQVMATLPLDRVIVPFPMYANRGYEYWRQTPEGRLVVGGWRNRDMEVEVGREERLNDRVQGALDQFVTAVTGQPAHIEYRWAGIMGFTPDLLPLVGPVPDAPGLFLAAGYSGHGVSMAFTCGLRAARLAAGLDAEIPAGFDPARFQSI